MSNILSNVSFNEEGYMTNPSEWTKEIAIENIDDYADLKINTYKVLEMIFLINNDLVLSNQSNGWVITKRPEKLEYIVIIDFETYGINYSTGRHNSYMHTKNIDKAKRYKTFKGAEREAETQSNYDEGLVNYNTYIQLVV